jgi:hypothetical protein
LIRLEYDNCPKERLINEDRCGYPRRFFGFSFGGSTAGEKLGFVFKPGRKY